MTTTWASPSYAVFGEVEIFWCAECDNDEIFDRPEGGTSPEAFCVSCGTAVFLWVGGSDMRLREDQPTASSTTPTSAVETPAA